MYTASSAETYNRSLDRSSCKTYSTLLAMVFLNLNCKYRASSLRLKMVQAFNRSLAVLLISKLHLASRMDLYHVTKISVGKTLTISLARDEFR